MPEQRTNLGGKVHVYKRPNSRLKSLVLSYFAGKIGDQAKTEPGRCRH
jgi:hypothetical protein